jgi:hypothetical protein
MERITVRIADITQLAVDTVLNAANTALLGAISSYPGRFRRYPPVRYLPWRLRLLLLQLARLARQSKLMNTGFAISLLPRFPLRLSLRALLPL